jgi:DNA repair exonuclease SbcCD ATPase subunit
MTQSERVIHDLRSQLEGARTRIRALEDELDGEKTRCEEAIRAETETWHTRAEKAEARVVNLLEMDRLDVEGRLKAEARVRELEAARQEAVDRLAEALARWPSVMARAEKAEAEVVDLKDRMAAGSRWLKAEIAGREKAEAALAELDALRQECWTMTDCGICEYQGERAAGRDSETEAAHGQADSVTVRDLPDSVEAAAKPAARTPGGAPPTGSSPTPPNPPGCDVHNLIGDVRCADCLTEYIRQGIVEPRRRHAETEES